MDHISTSFQLDLFAGNKEQVRIRFLRNGSELKIQDIHFITLTPIYAVDDGRIQLTKADWKVFVTTNALLLKDTLFISRGFFFRVATGKTYMRNW